MKKFTENELAKCHGKNGNPAYIAYKGKVYDMSGSFFGERGHTKFFTGPGGFDGSRGASSAWKRRH